MKTNTFCSTLDTLINSLNQGDTSDIEEWLTTKQIASELQLHINTVLRIIHSGKLKAYNIGLEGRRSYYRIKRSDLEEYLDQRYCRW